jgi:hypothetical protein
MSKLYVSEIVIVSKFLIVIGKQYALETVPQIVKVYKIQLECMVLNLHSVHYITMSVPPPPFIGLSVHPNKK